MNNLMFSGMDVKLFMVKGTLCSVTFADDNNMSDNQTEADEVFCDLPRGRCGLQSG